MELLLCPAFSQAFQLVLLNGECCAFMKIVIYHVFKTQKMQAVLLSLIINSVRCQKDVDGKKMPNCQVKQKCEDRFVNHSSLQNLGEGVKSSLWLILDCNAFAGFGLEQAQLIKRGENRTISKDKSAIKSPFT